MRCAWRAGRKPGAEVASLSLAGVIADGTAILVAAGITEARREALALWGSVAGIPTGDAALAALESRIAPADGWPHDELAARFQQAIARRASGEPLAYVTGRAGFRHLELQVDGRVLIPRPETEMLVELALDRVQHGVACDVGTGSGCIALSLAFEGRYRAVLAVDRSAEALALAQANARASGVTLQLVQSNLTSALDAASLDLLVSNPPYLTEAEWAALDPAVKVWEPRLALPSGSDGLVATSDLLQDGLRVLRPGGWLALEVDCTRAQKVACAAQDRGWREVEIVQDLFGRERYLLARTERSS